MSTYTYTIDNKFVTIFKNGNEWKKAPTGGNKAASKRWAERTIAAQIDMETNPNPEYF